MLSISQPTQFLTVYLFSVTLVVQTGLPSSAEQYIHRLGRTARAGASGRGILILSSFEKWFLQQNEVAALPIHPHPSLPILPTEDINTALAKVDQVTKAKAYQAWLGYYTTYMKKMAVTPRQFVEMANTYAIEILKYQGGQTPPIMAKTVGMMRLKGVPGLNIVRTLDHTA
jgi:ATP-dependent RNA helicase MSS116, mitochondrial